jgi:capsule polysaccharide export protein KpsE/RkpR
MANAALERLKAVEPAQPHAREHWAERTRLLWQHRHRLAWVGLISFAVSLTLALVIPKRYTASTSIMPPAQSNSNSMMLAALASRASTLGSMGTLASGLLADHSSTALFINLLRSGTVSGHLIDRFGLQHVYGNKYRTDTAKRLARVTKITDDKKSGVITIEVDDESPVRARDLAQAYLDELNKLVTSTNNSAAHQERIFIEQRLRSVQADLEQAQLALSAYSTKSGTIDLTDQTRAMVEGSERVEAELLIQRSSLQSLRQLYGDDNVRVREVEARIAALQQGLDKMAGTAPGAGAGASGDAAAGPDTQNDLYPPLRQLPSLAVPYADLYRRVKTEEVAFELLTQQYEMARIEEARDVPAVNVIDPPGIPEKKSSPPRRLITIALTALSLAVAAGWILFCDRWERLDSRDPRKTLAAEVLPVVRGRLGRINPFRKPRRVQPGGVA